VSDDRAQTLLRWRLALGPGAEKQEQSLGLGGLEEAAGEAAGIPRERLGELDEALEFVYGDKRAGRGGAAYLPRWLTALRDFFAHDVVAMVQRDAVERRGLAQLLLEPEALPYLERNVDLVATLLAAGALVPDEAKETARQLVHEVVSELRRKLETEVRTAVLGALRRGRRSPLPSARNLDWRRTLHHNLGRWDQEKRRLVAERFWFHQNQRRRHDWDVVLAVDQSGSMADSVVYAAVMGAIFASLDVLRTRMLLFDTEVVDVTPMLGDPVELLFSAQLGGGTDIRRAVAYAEEHLVERPERTLFLLVTDLYEGGDARELVARMRGLVESRVRALCLLALTDAGQPAYNHELARELTQIGVPCFACTPRLLVDVLGKVLRGEQVA